MTMTRTRHLTLVTLLLTMTRAADSQQPPRPTTLAHRSTVYAPHGMIATSQPLATAAGLAVLERGGNAVDAAVTAAAVLNVVEPPMTGIGGDMFAIVWSAKDRKLYGLNASGRAGSVRTRDARLAKGHATMPQQSVEDVTVPGALSGWDALLSRFGTVTLAQALAPAIGYAEQGFPVTPIISAEWGAEVARLRQDEGARATYLVEGDRAPRPGEWFRNPDLAGTLRLIARQGIGALYGGELGRRVASRAHRSRPRHRPPRPWEAIDRKRDDLPHRRRLERQHRVVHQLAVRCVRLQCSRAGHRVRAAGPRRGIHARSGAAEYGRPGEAAVPHHHPRVRHAARRRGRRRPVAQLRGHGRLDAAAGPRAAAAQPHRVRNGPSGGDRCPPLPAPGGAARRAGGADHRCCATCARHAGPRGDVRGRRLRRSPGDHAAAAGLRRRLGSPKGRHGRRVLSTVRHPASCWPLPAGTFRCTA